MAIIYKIEDVDNGTTFDFGIPIWVNPNESISQAPTLLQEVYQTYFDLPEYLTFMKSGDVSGPDYLEMAIAVNNTFQNNTKISPNVIDLSPYDYGYITLSPTFPNTRTFKCGDNTMVVTLERGGVRHFKITNGDGNVMYESDWYSTGESANNNVMATRNAKDWEDGKVIFCRYSYEYPHPEYGTSMYGFTNWDFSTTSPTTMNTSFELLWWLTRNQEFTEENPDPFVENDGDGTGGGILPNPTIDEPVDFPPISTVNTLALGLYHAYTPDASIMSRFGGWLWSNSIIDTLKRVMANPFDSLISLHVLPINVPSTRSGHIVMGNLDSEITSNIATQQIVRIDCGSLTISEPSKTASFLNYAKASIKLVLPFVGVVDLDVNDVFNKTIAIKYDVDILTGTCTAMVKCGDHVNYMFNGNMAMTIPLTGTDYSQKLQGLMNLAVSGTTALKNANALSKSEPKELTGLAKASMGVTSVANIIDASAGLLNMNGDIQRSGSFGGNTGYLSPRKPYLIIEYPNAIATPDRNKYQGYPSYWEYKLSTLTGFTKVHDIHLNNINCLEEERSMIDSLLKGGVIL